MPGCHPQDTDVTALRYEVWPGPADVLMYNQGQESLL